MRLSDQPDLVIMAQSEIEGYVLAASVLVGEAGRDGHGGGQPFYKIL